MTFVITEKLYDLCLSLIEFGQLHKLGEFIWPVNVPNKPFVLLYFCPSEVILTNLLERNEDTDSLKSRCWEVVEALLAPSKHLGVDFGVWNVFPYKSPCK